MIKKSSAPLILVAIFVLILLAGASVQVPVKAEPSTYSPSKVLTVTYSWERDHCESCDYLAEQIKSWMILATGYGVHDTKAGILSSNIATNYLKLYEINGCHEYYRNTSIGPFHMALELKALEEKRLE